MKNIKKYEFLSSFADDIRRFVEHKRALGFDYAEGEYCLFRFDAFCLENFPSTMTLSQEIGLKWAELRDGETGASQLNRIGVVRGFGKFLNSIGVQAYVIPPNIHMKKVRPKAYIFSDGELAALFRAADEFSYKSRSPLFHITVPVIYRLIYCCGLRPVETRRLKCADVNWVTGEIKICESKGHKDRIVVMADEVKQLALRYHENVECDYPGRTYFFHNATSKNGAMISEVWLVKTFAILLNKAGIAKIDKQRPRAYDLRHTFATNRLQHWLDEGEDIEGCISYLSEYMGHGRLSDTAYYIHLVPNFYAHSVNRKFLTKAAIMPEVPA